MKQINSKWITVSLIACCFFAQKTDAQINDANISGSFQLNLQNSQQNTAIGAQEVKEGILSNAYADIFYNWKNFRAGLRYEYYSPPTLNLDRRFEGQGIATRFVNFKKDKFEFTLGNFYDQYGSGLIFRSYEERSLGYDNAMNGVQVKYNPTPGVYLKGMVGKQRTFWEYSDGYTRGLDGEFNLNDLNLLAKDCDLNVDLGASFVSKYQQSTSTLYNMPLNVGAYSLRAALQYKKVAADVEFVGKSQDPSAQNNYVLSKGKGLLINSSYSTRGFGASLSLKHVDNMDFRSDREQSGQVLLVNYNPALTKQNTWALTTFFPYPTVNLGETGLLAEINYKVPKKSLGVLGGTYL
ncbi:MAG: DUF6029 family protein, partial [Flavobacteriales bacterium]